MKSWFSEYLQTKVTLWIFVLFFSLLVSCSGFVSEDLKELNLKGDVKSVTTLKYKAVEKFGVIEKKKRTYREDDDLTDLYSNTIIDFNESGKFKKAKFMDSDGKSVLVMKVDSDSSATIYSGEGERVMVLKFRDKGGLMKGDFYLANGDLFLRTITEFNKKNQPVEEMQYNADGKLVGFEKKQYDNNGLISEIEQMEQVPGRRSYYDAEVQRITNYHFTYNEHNDPIKIDYTKYNQTEHRECTYEYDKIGNWIRQYIVVDSKPEFVVEREIVYHE